MAKKLTALFMALIMSMSILPASAFATESGESTNPAVPEIPAEIGTKTAQVIDANANRYKVSIDVPGGDEIKTHDEVCTAPVCTDSTKKTPGRKILNFKRSGAA